MSNNDNNETKNRVTTFVANMIIISLGLAVSAVALGLAWSFLSWLF